MICAGSMRRPGWKTLDADERTKPDFHALIPPLPFEVHAIKWNEVEWIHGITSLFPWEGLAVLREIRDILAPEGKLVLEQPDARIAAKYLLNGGDPRWLFGDPADKNPGIMNRWAFTPDALYQTLREAGFSRVVATVARHHVPERDFRMEAWA